LGILQPYTISRKRFAPEASSSLPSAKERRTFQIREAVDNEMFESRSFPMLRKKSMVL
jgi:hypothetical protein